MRLSAICRSDSARTRAAANSIASGIPSSRRQMSANQFGVLADGVECGSCALRPVGEQRDGLVV